MKNVKDIYQQGLCHGCGTCTAICPTSAIKISLDRHRGVFFPEVDDNQCNECGLCLKVCPGLSVDFVGLNQYIFEKQPEDVWLGNYLGLYAGHASDNEIRYYASSGGMITALLIFALEQGLINGALVTSMDPENPLEPKVFIARNRDEVISAHGSKYCPVPANIGLKEIIKEKGKFAVVGLPCHIHGIRKLEQEDKRLKGKIVLHLGLMCSNNSTLLATEYFLHKKRIHASEVKEFAYRRGGWLPKKEFYLRMINEEDKILHSPKGGLKAYWHNYLDITTYHRHFVHTRCLMCCDQTNELTDISFGDARLPELVRIEKAGESIIITRTKTGEEIFQGLLLGGKAQLYEKLNVNRFYQAQQISKYKKYFNARLKLFNAFDKATPVYNTPKLMEPIIFSNFLDFITYIPSYFTSRRYLWWLLYFYYSVDFVRNMSLKIIRFGKRLLLHN